MGRIPTEASRVLRVREEGFDRECFTNTLGFATICAPDTYADFKIAVGTRAVQSNRKRVLRWFMLGLGITLAWLAGIVLFFVFDRVAFATARKRGLADHHKYHNFGGGYLAYLHTINDLTPFIFSVVIVLIVLTLLTVVDLPPGRLRVQ
jgi:hypothetical protein